MILEYFILFFNSFETEGLFHGKDTLQWNYPSISNALQPKFKSKFSRTYAGNKNIHYIYIESSIKSRSVNVCRIF